MALSLSLRSRAFAISRAPGGGCMCRCSSGRACICWRSCVAGGGTRSWRSPLRRLGTCGPTCRGRRSSTCPPPGTCTGRASLPYHPPCGGSRWLASPARRSWRGLHPSLPDAPPWGFGRFPSRWPPASGNAPASGFDAHSGLSQTQKVISVG